MSADVVKVDAIRVEDRARREYVDIDTLAASIESIGLLHPLVVTGDFRLVAGGRRLEAVRYLGWESVPVTVVANLVEVAALLQAESDENTERLPLKPTEAADLARKIEAVLAPLARDRQGTLNNRPASAKFAEAPEPRPRELGAKAAGTSHESIRKVRVVQEVIESEATPEPVREIARAALAEMDATGRVDGAYRRVKDAEQIVTAQPSEAVQKFLDEDPSLQDSRYVLAFLKAVARADDFLAFDAERLARLDPEAIRTVEHLLKSTESFFARMKTGSGLRLVAGSTQ